MTTKVIFNSTTKKKVAKILKDIKKGKNLSPKFTTAKEAIAYLKK